MAVRDRLEPRRAPSAGGGAPLRALSRTDATHAVDSHAERVAGRLDARALRGRLAAALVEGAVKTTSIDPLKAGNSTGEVRKGSTVIAERLATAIADKPGQTH
jgi:hypothetical protein